jgi:hypothetical protein
MTTAPWVSDTIAKEWTSALGDSSLKESDVHLITVSGTPLQGRPKAYTFTAGRLEADDPRDGVLHGRTLTEANRAENVHKVRVVIFDGYRDETDAERAVIAGKLRHELRHAEHRVSEQWSLIWDLELLYFDCAEFVTGEDSGGWLEELCPTEVDCNAVAARYLRTFHPESVSAVLDGDDGKLALIADPPVPIAELPGNLLSAILALLDQAKHGSADLDPVELGQLKVEATSIWRASRSV